MKILLLALLLFLASCSVQYTEQHYQKAIVVKKIVFATGGLVSYTNYILYVKPLDAPNQTIIIYEEERYIEGDTVIVYDKNVGRPMWNIVFEKYRWGVL